MPSVYVCVRAIRDIKPRKTFSSCFAEKKQQNFKSIYVSSVAEPVFRSCIHISFVYLCVSVSVYALENSSYFMNFFNTIFFAPPSSLFILHISYIYAVVAAQPHSQPVSLSLYHAKKYIINSIWELLAKSVYIFVTSVNFARAREQAAYILFVLWDTYKTE